MTEQTGHLVAVWHPSGAPGGTFVAAALADHLARYGSTVLVDADLTRGTLAAVMGTEPGPTLATACEARPTPARPLPEGIVQRPQRDGAWVIPGVPGPSHPIGVDPDCLARLLAYLRRTYQTVVVDVGAALPPQAHGLGHHAVLQQADTVLVVGRDSPQGMSDLRLQVPVVHQSLPLLRRPAVWGVLNHADPTRIAARVSLLRAEVGLTVIAEIPSDTESVRAAMERHQPVTRVRPRCAASVALGRLADQVQRRS